MTLECPRWPTALRMAPTLPSRSWVVSNGQQITGTVVPSSYECEVRQHAWFSLMEWVPSSPSSSVPSSREGMMEIQLSRDLGPWITMGRPAPNQDQLHMNKHTSFVLGHWHLWFICFNRWLTHIWNLCLRKNHILRVSTTWCKRCDNLQKSKESDGSRI